MVDNYKSHNGENKGMQGIFDTHDLCVCVFLCVVNQSFVLKIDRRRIRDPLDVDQS
jgi:hypothetical protein